MAAWVDICVGRESQCLCHDGSSCLICRLQKRVQEAEASRYEAEQEQDTEAAGLDETVEEQNDLLEDLDRLEAENELLKDKMDNLKGFVAEVRKENTKLKERNSKLHEGNSELRELIRQLGYENQKPIKYGHRSIPGATRITPNSGSSQAAGGPLDHNLDSSPHKHARHGVIERRIVSSGKTDGPEKLRDTNETDGEDGGFQSTSLRDHHTTFFPTRRERGGKYRGDGNPSWHGEPMKRKRADEADKVTKDLEPPRKRHRHAMPTSGRLAQGGMNDASGSPIQKGVTFTDESEDSHPVLKHHNSVIRSNKKPAPVEERHSGNTTKLTEKRIEMNRSHQIDGDSDDTPPQSSRSLVNHLLGKIDKGTDPTRKINGRGFGVQKGAEKKRHYESDDDEDGDDDFKPDAKRQRCVKTHTSNLELGTMSTKYVRGFQSAGRATNNSRSSFLDCLGDATSQDGQTTTNTVRIRRSTNNSLANFLDGHPGVTIPDISQRNVSNASTGGRPPATSLPPQAPQPNHACTDGRRSTGWTDRERQAFIGLMNIQVNHTPEEDRLHDVHLYEFMSAQLRQRHGVNRNPGACKNEWNRRLRAFSGIDERKVKNPRKLATSVQAAGS